MTADDPRLKARYITIDEAKRLFEAKFWEPLTARERVEFQLFTNMLCMPFEVLHEALGVALGRPVWTHELAWPEKLRAEFLGDRPPPSFQEIMDLIPAEKRVVIVVPEPAHDPQ